MAIEKGRLTVTAACMKTLALPFAASLSLFIGACSSAPHRAQAAIPSPPGAAVKSSDPGGSLAPVIGITDGDTLTVMRNGHLVEKIRLAGIDAPEKGQPFGNVSKAELAALVSDQIVYVGRTGKDRYGRTLARITTPGIDVNLQMVRQGLAWHCLWADPAPVPPWEWRKSQKERRAAAIR